AAAVEVWAAGDAVKVGPDTPPPPRTPVWEDGRISVKAAQGEWGTFQLVLRSDVARLVSFRVFDLQGLRGSFRGANVKIFRELYLPVTQPSVDLRTNFTVGLGPGRYPDPLVPVMGHTEVAAGENAVLWCEFFVPPDTSPGQYVGDVVLEWSGGERVLSLELTVWDFSVAAAVRPIFTAELNPENVLPFYGLEREAGAAESLVDRYRSLLADHGVATEEGAAEAVASVAEGEAYREAAERLRAAGKAVAWEGGDFALIDRPASDPRLLGWALWRLGGDSVRLGPASYFSRKEAEPLTDDPRNEYGNGAGVLIYPGDETTGNRPRPSLRLKLLREAAEDYAYLTLLAEAGYGAYADELAAAAATTVGGGAAKSVPAEVLYDTREAAALAIVKSRWRQGITENTVRGRAVSEEGLAVAGAVVRAGPLAAVTDREGEYVLAYVPRGRSLTAEAPGFERAGASGAGGRGDFYLRHGFRRFLLNEEGPAERYSDRGFEGARLVADANAVGGPAFVAALKARKPAVFAFAPELLDWATFGALAVEVFNGGSEAVAARLRAEDNRGGFYEEAFALAPEGWTTARIELSEVRRRYYLKADGSGGDLHFETKARLGLEAVNEVELALESPGGAPVKIGRVWLEAVAE
ncbi:MAG: DUF4091 domain-containing protein, partial [Candidatus Coatesbacteria bacterium]